MDVKAQKIIIQNDTGKPIKQNETDKVTVQNYPMGNGFYTDLNPDFNLVLDGLSLPVFTINFFNKQLGTSSANNLIRLSFSDGSVVDFRYRQAYVLEWSGYLGGNYVGGYAPGARAGKFTEDASYFWSFVYNNGLLSWESYSNVGVASSGGSAFSNVFSANLTSIKFGKNTFGSYSQVYNYVSLFNRVINSDEKFFIYRNMSGGNILTPNGLVSLTNTDAVSAVNIGGVDYPGFIDESDNGNHWRIDNLPAGSLTSKIDFANINCITQW